MTRKTLIILLLMCGVARAQISYTHQDGSVSGLEQQVEQWKVDYTAGGGSNWWAWGALSFTDPTGTYIHFAGHGHGGKLYRQQSGGTWAEVTLAPVDGKGGPQETQPLHFDVDNDGDLDLVHTGNESPTSTGARNNGDGTWTVDPALAVRNDGEVMDLNGDGFMDVRCHRRNYGDSWYEYHINQAGAGFVQSTVYISGKWPTENGGALYYDIDSDGVADNGTLPTEVETLLDTQADTNTTTNRYHGTTFYQVDLDGDGDLDVVVSYGGSYGGNFNRWNRICENQSGTLVVNQMGVTNDHDIIDVADYDGDGTLDLVGQWGSATLYLQKTPGTFTAVTGGDAAGIADVLDRSTSAYKFRAYNDDLDGDGDPDLVINTRRNCFTRIWENDGTGVFTQVLSASHSDGDGSWHLNDIDGDGDWDIVVWGEGENQASGTTMSTDQVAFYFMDGTPDPPAPLTLPPPVYDENSANWARFLPTVNESASGSRQALAYYVTGTEIYRTRALAAAQATVDADNVDGNQYLSAQTHYSTVARAIAWCEPSQQQSDEWIAWMRNHLGETDGSLRPDGTQGIWWSNRWSRENPANNYFHSFVTATSYYCMVTGDTEWIDFLKNDRLPLITGYYGTTLDGGSREGTGYGESHRSLFTLQKLWRDYDGYNFLPQAFINNSILYWTHATTPGHAWVALIGDHTRSHGRTDGYHRHLISSAIELCDNPTITNVGYWQLENLPDINSATFYILELKDYPTGVGSPPSTTEYYAQGAGHFFSRTAWTDAATYVYCTAGEHDEAHQQEDQGAFGVWAAEEWQTCSDSPWTHGGIAQDTDFQNVVRFPAPWDVNIHNSVSTLSYDVDGSTVTVDMDLTNAVGRAWTREVTWVKGSGELNIRDYCDPSDATWGFCVPDPTDLNPPSTSTATADVTTEVDGFSATVSFPTTADPPVGVAANITNTQTALSIPERTMGQFSVFATGDTPITFSIIGGTDAAAFTLASEETESVVMLKRQADYERPHDVGGNNTYEVTVQATNASGSDSETFTVTISDVSGSYRHPLRLSNGDVIVIEEVEP